MSDDDKLDFFLRHWKVIVEWSALRTHAADTLDRALTDALENLSYEEGWERLEISQSAGTHYGIRHLPGKTHHAWLEFQWRRKDLFEGWPLIIVVWNQTSSTTQVRDAVKRATASTCSELRMTESSNGWWVWYAKLSTTDEPFDLEEYARDCVKQYRRAWIELHGLMDTAVSGVLNEGRY